MQAARPRYSGSKVAELRTCALLLLLLLPHGRHRGGGGRGLLLLHGRRQHGQQLPRLRAAGLPELGIHEAQQADGVADGLQRQ